MKRLIIGVEVDVEIDAILPKIKNTDYSVERLHDIGNEIDSFITSSKGDLELIDDKEVFFVKYIFPHLEYYKQELYSTYFLHSEDSQEIFELLDGDEKLRFIQWDNESFECELPNAPPNDPLYMVQWAMEDIDIQKAWRKSNRAWDVPIAVIDSGIDINHEDLKDAMWLDTNGNAGYNFVNNNYDTSDSSGHGTHVAGVIAARAYNRKHIAGAALRCKVMNLKVMPGGYDSYVSKAIKYAVDNGAVVINISLGLKGRKQINKVIHEAFHYAYFNRCTVVCAAGNNNDDVKYYYFSNNPTTIVVGAYKRDVSKLPESNFGKGILISAPGEGIVSLAPNNKTSYKNGTSQAAAFVSSSIALNYSKNRDITSPDYFKRHLYNLTAKPISNVPLGKRLNADYFVVGGGNYKISEKYITFKITGVKGCKKQIDKGINSRSKKWFEDFKNNNPSFNIFDSGIYNYVAHEKRWVTSRNERKCRIIVQVIAYCHYV